MGFSLNRRQALMGSAGFALALGAGLLAPSRARAANGYEEELSSFTGGAELQSGRISLSVPEIAENGNTVPLEVSVESPMSSDDYVESVLVLATGNPNPGVATFNFTPISGRAAASTRIRLAETQDVIAVARMIDGTYFMDRREVRVTIGGCGG